MIAQVWVESTKELINHGMFYWSISARDHKTDAATRKDWYKNV